MTYKFKVGDTVLATEAPPGTGVHLAVITGLAWHLGRWVPDCPYYNVRYAVPGSKPYHTCAEELLRLIQDPNDIMKEML